MGGAGGMVATWMTSSSLPSWISARAAANLLPNMMESCTWVYVDNCRLVEDRGLRNDGFLYGALVLLLAISRLYGGRNLLR